LKQNAADYPSKSEWNTQAMAISGVSANRIELLQIADAVAREKSIDRTIVIDAMQDAIRDVTGATAELSTSGGTSDARFIQAACPVIEFGLVNQTIHQVDEHVEVADLVKLSEIYERFIEGYFERGGL
jgi:acetylornithine deacetylase/succinyl-diaminopimelate desuccinylase-like protein